MWSVSSWIRRVWSFFLPWSTVQDAGHVSLAEAASPSVFAPLCCFSSVCAAFSVFSQPGSWSSLFFSVVAPCACQGFVAPAFVALVFAVAACPSALAFCLIFFLSVSASFLSFWRPGCESSRVSSVVTRAPARALLRLSLRSSVRLVRACLFFQFRFSLACLPACLGFLSLAFFLPLLVVNPFLSCFLICFFLWPCPLISSCRRCPPCR